MRSTFGLSGASAYLRLLGKQERCALRVLVVIAITDVGPMEPQCLVLKRVRMPETGRQFPSSSMSNKMTAGVLSFELDEPETSRDHLLHTGRVRRGRVQP